jgi:proteasome accessory factor C
VSGATDHLPRLLALVPWLLARPETPVSDAAREFGISESQLRADLNLIWMCGLPGYGPGDLIDVVWDGDRVSLSNADTIERPLRLTREEALALVAALRTLRAVPGLTDTRAVDRALAKLESAAGTTVGEEVTVAGEAGTNAEVVAAVTDALARNQRVHLRYWVPARDEQTERDVDPLRMFTAEGTVYLVGWCYRVGDLRTFRLDRALSAEVLDVAVDVPEEARRRAQEDELFRPSPEDRVVTLLVGRGARWIVDYYPCEDVQEQDGRLVVRLRARDDAWIRRLALGLAGDVTVVDPPEVVADVRSAAAAALSAYGVDLAAS